MFKSTFRFMILLFTHHLLFAATPQLQWEGSWNRGSYIQIAHTDTQLLAAIYENGLDILRTDTQGTLTFLGKYDLGSETPRQVLADTAVAYVLTSKRLLIIDLQDPLAPSLLSEFAVEARHALLDQSTLYLLGDKITRLDISQPQAPTVLFENATERGARQGFLLDDRLVIFNNRSQIEIFKQEADGELVPVLQNEPNEFGFFGAIGNQGNRIYLANGGVTAYEISSESRVSQLGRFETNLLIFDIAVFDTTMVLAGQDQEFSGFEIVRLDEGDTPFLQSFRTPIGQFSSLLAVDQKQFYGLSAQRGIEEFRPEASFAKVASFSPGRLATDIAFYNPYVYLASPGKLEVLSFTDPSNPEVTARYPGLSEESQKVLLQDGMLHLASPQNYQRYQIETDGTLVLELQRELGIEFVPTFQFPQAEMKALQVQKDRVLLAFNRTLVTLLPDRITENPILQNEFGVFTQNDQIILEAPYLYAREDHILDIHEVDANGVPNLLMTQRLTQSEGPIPHPTSLHGPLLLAGAQVFDIRNKERFRQLPKAETNLEGAVSEDGFIYGMAPDGLQVWDFAKPESPQLVWERRDTPGEAILLDDGAAVTFQKSPNLINYFSREAGKQTSFLPIVQTSFPGDGELFFVNAGDIPATVKLRAFSTQASPTLREITVGPKATHSIVTSSILSPPVSFRLFIEAPRAVKATYIRNQKTVNGQTLSAAMIAPTPVESLSNQVIINIPSTDTQNEVFIASAEPESGFSLQLQFFGESGLIDETELFLLSGIGIGLTPSVLFDQVQPGQAGMLVATAADGNRIAGAVLTNPRQGPEAMSASFPVDLQNQSPLRSETLGSLGFSDIYSQRYVFNGDLLLAGGEGVLILNQTDSPNRIPTESLSLDAAMDDTRVWVLTKDALEVRQRSDGKLLGHIPNRFDANRIYRNGDFLFLWNPQFVSVHAVQTNSKNDLIEKESIQTQGHTPTQVLLLKDQLFVMARRAFLTFNYRDSSQAELIDIDTETLLANRMTTDGEFLYLFNFRGAIKLEPQMDAAPSVLPFDAPFDLVSINESLGLTHDPNEDRFTIFNLSDGEPLQSFVLNSVGSLRDVHFSSTRLWLVNSLNKVFEYDISTIDEPVLLRKIGEKSEFSQVAETGKRIYANTPVAGQHILHELKLDDTGLSSETWDMGAGIPTGIAAKGDYLYLSDRHQGLVIVKLDPEVGPTRVGTLEGSFSHVEVNDQHLVTLEDSFHIGVYDLQDPAAPVFQGETFTENDQAIAIGLDGNLLLIAEPSFGLSIFDLSTPQSPKIVGSVATSKLRLNGRTMDMAFSENHAYLADRLDLSVVDYSDPANPVLVKRFPFNTSQVKIQAGYLFSSAEPFPPLANLNVFDLTFPKEPKLFGNSLNIGNYDSVLVGQTLWTTNGITIRASSLQPVRATVPWVVQNSRFQTQVQISNSSNQPQPVMLRASTTTGASQSTQIQLPPFSLQELLSTELFPELSGYALSVESANPKIQASFSTVGIGTGIKSQAQALANPSTRLQDGLVLNVPEQPATSALALHAPLNTTRLEVTLRLFGSQGFLGQTLIQLQDKQPMVYLLESLFPEATPGGAYMITAATKNGALLDGCTFLFDNEGRPAKSEGTPQSALMLPTPPQAE